MLVRHAEKAGPGEEEGGDPRDPSLSEAGRKRARALARLLRRAGVSHLFTSEFRRTKETLAPLAAASGIEAVAVPARETAALVDRLRALPAGSLAVVAGHSNTVPAIATALGARGLRDLASTPQGPALEDDEHDRLLVLALAAVGSEGVEDAAATAVLDLAYGD